MTVAALQRPGAAERQGCRRDIQPEFIEAADSVIWKQSFVNAKPALDRAISAAGRIELQGRHLDRVGTERLVALDSMDAGDRAPPGRLRNSRFTR